MSTLIVAPQGSGLVSSQAGVPTSTPWAVGLLNIDLTSDNAYISVDTLSSADWIQINGGGGGGATGVEILEIGTATYDDMQDWLNTVGSAGRISGFDITDAGGATVDVAAGKGFIRSSNSAVADNYSFDFAGSAGHSITADAIRYIGIEYNSGTPRVVVKTTDTWNMHDEFRIGSVVNEGGTLFIMQSGQDITEAGANLWHRLWETRPLEYASKTGGLMVSESGTRNLTLTAGVLYDGVSEFAITSKDTNPAGAADTFDVYYTNGGWTKVAAQSAWNNTQYDNAGTLTTLGNNKYGVHWLFVDANDNLVLVYGQAQYASQAEAEFADVPSSLPNRLNTHGILLAQLVFKKSAATLASINSAFEQAFIGSAAANHLNLTNIGTNTHAQIDTAISNSVSHLALTDEHVAHSGVTLTAGDGLSGGGDITTNRSFALDINGIANAGTTCGANDLFAYYDATTDNRLEKITFANLNGQLDHDALTNFAANEHIDWTGASAGTIHATNYVDNDTTDHTALSNIGSNSHSTIDTHLGSSSNPHSVTAAQAGALTLVGISGGQQAYGSTDASENLILSSTSNGTKGVISITEALGLQIDINGTSPTQLTTRGLDMQTSRSAAGKTILATAGTLTDNAILSGRDNYISGTAGAPVIQDNVIAGGWLNYMTSAVSYGVEGCAIGGGIQNITYGYGVRKSQYNTIPGGINNQIGGAFACSCLGRSNNIYQSHPSYAQHMYCTAIGYANIIKDGCTDTTLIGAGNQCATFDKNFGIGAYGAASADNEFWLAYAASGASANNQIFNVELTTGDVHVGARTDQTTRTDTNVLKLHTPNASNQTNYQGLACSINATTSDTYYLGLDTETQAASNTHTIDWQHGNSAIWDLEPATGDVTLTLSNPCVGGRYTIKIIQASTQRNITWPGTVLWPGGAAPTISAAEDAIDKIELFWDGANYLGTFEQAYA